jgi:hypothetical protein
LIIFMVVLPGVAVDAALPALCARHEPGQY